MYRPAQQTFGRCVHGQGDCPKYEARRLRVGLDNAEGRSGLGLEAQHEAEYAEAKRAAILARFTEVKSGRKYDRLELGAALGLARLTGARPVIAKLGWLSRNAAFLLTLHDSGVRFVGCDMPEANDLTVGIMALGAQQEREAISRRTKEALAAAKAREVMIGNPNAAAALRKAASRNADDYARGIAPVIVRLRSEGVTLLRGLAEALSDQGMMTLRGGRWHVSNIRNLLARLATKPSQRCSPGRIKLGRCPPHSS